MSWADDQKWESEWHANCVNSYWEETKQIVYARKMGLVPQSIDGKYPVYDLHNQSVTDIGGGAYSMLLKCVNFSYAHVIDPCDYPKWVGKRYKAAHIEYSRCPAEDMNSLELLVKCDEVWIYNCLQHVQDPERIIANVKGLGSIIRIFEWVDNGVSVGHPHDLKREKLDAWLGGYGKVEEINESGCHGKCYYGIFEGNV